MRRPKKVRSSALEELKAMAGRVLQPHDLAGHLAQVMEKIVGELHERIDTLERPKKRATQKRKPAAK